MLDIDPQKLEKMIVQEAASQLLSEPEEDGGDRFSRLLSDIRKEVNARIDRLFAESADAMISEALDKAIKDGFEREYNKLTAWGEREGEPTTISKELEKIVSRYWSEKVDGRGKPSDGYGAITRAERLMTEICAEDFSKSMKGAVLDVTGALKDGLRNQIAAQVDGMLSELFKVKSLQDQGKVERPWGGRS